MNKGQVEKAERLAVTEFDKWNDVTEAITYDYSEIEGIIKDAVHIGIQMALYGKVLRNKDGSIRH